MAERRGHKGIASLIIVVTGLCALTGGCLAYITANSDDWGDGSDALLLVVVTAAVVLGGLLLAWRVGSGRWGLRRQRTTTAIVSPPAPPSAFTALASPFRFWATRTAPVLAPGSLRPIGRLEKAGEYTAVGASGTWVLIEDKCGRRGWVPDSVVPARVQRRHKKGGEGGS